MTDGNKWWSRAVAVVFVVCLLLWIPAVSTSVVAGPVTTDQRTVDTSEGTNTTDATGAASEKAQAQMALARDLQSVMNDESRSKREVALDAAGLAMTKRQEQLAESQTGTQVASQVGTQQTNLRGARTLLEIMDGTRSEEKGRTVRIAETGVKLQVAQMSDNEQSIDPSQVDFGDIKTPDHESPSAAIYSLYDRYNITPTADEASEIRAFDELPEPTRSELTDVIDAYIAFNDATRTTASNLDKSWLNSVGEIVTHKQTNNIYPRADVTKVRAAQIQLLAAAENLSAPVGDSDLPEFTSPATHASPICTKGLGNDNYTTDCALLIDPGGSDNYTNNAGGSQGFGHASALIDLSGNDDYNGRNGGANGLGSAGFLFDSGGNDEYIAGGSGTAGFGTNGGATQLGTGFLVDVAGSDYYDAGSNGTNGGGRFVGTGFLLDAGTQKDRYNASYDAVNGGARFQGAGMLIDAGGMGAGDQYITTGDADYKIGADPGGGIQGGNGGGTNGGIAFLLDAGTQGDTYVSGSNATNGGGRFLGVGFLLDVGGNDSYTANSTDRSVDGVNGGGWSGGIGALLDIGGSDTYLANSINNASHGVNGGTSALPRSGTLLDDVGILPANGMLLDAGQGDDNYTVKAYENIRGANGGSHLESSGLLLDDQGTEIYSVLSTNGTTKGVNGGVHNDGAGLLLDILGSGDEYTQNCGTGHDDIWATKGHWGAQLDLQEYIIDTSRRPKPTACRNRMPF